MGHYGPIRDIGLVEDPAAALADAGAAALAPVLGPVVVVPGERLPSSDRAVVLRAVATDRAGRSHRVVLKALTGSGLGSAREEAALGLVAPVQVPGVVRLLATSTDPALLVLADVGDGPTLADRLLADDPVAAETAVLKWAARLAGLQAATGTRNSSRRTRCADWRTSPTSRWSTCSTGSTPGPCRPQLGILVTTQRGPRSESFAQRAKGRPDRLGVSICRLREVRDLAVTVQALDAIDGTPVLNLKPYMREFGPRGEVRQPTRSTELMAGYWSSSAASSLPGPNVSR